MSIFDLHILPPINSHSHRWLNGWGFSTCNLNDRVCGVLWEGLVSICFVLAICARVYFWYIGDGWSCYGVCLSTGPVNLTLGCCCQVNSVMDIVKATLQEAHHYNKNMREMHKLLPPGDLCRDSQIWTKFVTGVRVVGPARVQGGCEWGWEGLVSGVTIPF